MRVVSFALSTLDDLLEGLLLQCFSVSVSQCFSLNILKPHVSVAKHDQISNTCFRGMFKIPCSAYGRNLSGSAKILSKRLDFEPSKTLPSL